MKPSSVGSQNACLEENYQVFQSLIAKSKTYLLKGQYHYSAALAEIAAYYATWKHNGLFSSYELEEILHLLAKQTIQIENPPVKNTSDVKRVLHITSMVAGQAGLQHLLQRWIENDSSRCHSVAVSQPSISPVPEKLQSLVAASRGSIELVGNNYKRILERAQRLRKLATEADLIILHLQTEDVAPIIGLSQKTGMPPILLVNHADHCFWIGVTVVDLIVNLRTSGLILCQERRGIEPERLVLLPTPLTPVKRTLSQPEAKRRLGLSEDAVLLVSIARAPKYRPWNNINFPLDHVPLLQQHPNCFLFVVGPEHDKNWEYASQQTGGRIKAFGIRSDVSLFFQSADIYVDAFPMVSITSLLEAGSYGIPLVSYSLFSAKQAVWRADAPGIDQYLIRCQNINEYRNKLSLLVENAELRSKLGWNIQEDITRLHIGESWLESVDTLYERAKTISRKSDTFFFSSQRNISELDLVTPQILKDYRTIERLFYDYRHLLPRNWLHLRVRLRIWMIVVLQKLGLKQQIQNLLGILNRQE
ncbi:glycosyltransferase [Anabaena azotica]|uniref:Glycosyltransferase n=1 Tax=Anabaena azotica FACHB-119 TaxID=947527 RepID=A0ABR8D3Z7_9NOST|nr:glycosyltransferase [Anabaena azotica]MBD2501910.1 glycosyltransferase [Anabaena azotica FACHB-119]